MFQLFQTPWLEFIDAKELSCSLEAKALEWKQTGTPEQNQRSKEPKGHQDSDGTGMIFF